MSTPGWVTSVPSTPAVHQDPNPKPSTRPLTNQQLGQIGGQLIEQFLRRVVTAVVGIFLPHNSAFSQLFNWGHNLNLDLAGTIETANSAASQARLARTERIRPGRVQVVAFSTVSDGLANLLVSPDFPSSVALSGSTDWIWDGTQDHTGTAGSGSARTTGSSEAKSLLSNEIEVAADEAMAVSTWVKYSGVTATASSNAIRISVAQYLNRTLVSTQMISGVASPSGSAGWTQLSGSYTVPSSGVDSIRVQIGVTSALSDGTVWFDDIFAAKTGTSSATIGGINQTANNASSTATSAGTVASSAWTATNNLHTSLVAGFTVVPITSNQTWTRPDNLSEIYVAVFGGGGKGYDGSTGSTTASGGAGGTAGGFIAQQLDTADVPSSVVCTIGAGTTVGTGEATSFGSLLSTSTAFRGYVATPLGLQPTGSAPANGGAGGNESSNGSAGSATTVGTAGGSGGAKKFSPDTAGGAGGSGGNGTNFGLCYTGGAGGGGGGAISGGAIGTATGGAGGSGGFPGGGGGGGGAVTAVGGTKVGGSGGAGGNGLILIIYKTADN